MLTSGRGLSQFLNLVTFGFLQTSESVDNMLHDPKHSDEGEVLDKQKLRDRNFLPD